ncbi:MAG: hypothetical protein ACFNKE_09165 [Neisseria elongata]
MDTLNEILDYNRNFVESGEYAQFFSNKYPEAAKCQVPFSSLTA